MPEQVSPEDIPAEVKKQPCGCEDATVNDVLLTVGALQLTVAATYRLLHAIAYAVVALLAASMVLLVIR